jgi:BlaI family transcriptional regulator, penicillinase repressor
MRKVGSSKPTEVELLILQVLWENGPSTARAVHNALCEEKATNYSTTVKMLSIMLKKGLVQRNEAANPHVYRPVSSQRAMQRRMLSQIVQDAFAGSAASLVLQALSSQKASAEELAAIRQLLDELEDKRA